MKALYLGPWVCKAQSQWRPRWPGPDWAPASPWWSSPGRWRTTPGSSSAPSLEWCKWWDYQLPIKPLLTLTCITGPALCWETDAKPGWLGESHLVMSWQADDVCWARIKIAWQEEQCIFMNWQDINEYQASMPYPHLNSPALLSCWDSLVLCLQSDHCSGGLYLTSWWHILAYANHSDHPFIWSIEAKPT